MNTNQAMNPRLKGEVIGILNEVCSMNIHNPSDSDLMVITEHVVLSKLAPAQLQMIMKFRAKCKEKS